MYYIKSSVSEREREDRSFHNSMEINFIHRYIKYDIYQEVKL